jgi:homoserine/homoserine lactone efflux protein
VLPILKALVFYVAFLPQFLTERAPLRLQLIGLGMVDLLLVAIVFGSYVLVGSGLVRLLRRSGVQAWFDRCIGGVMIGSATLVLRTVRPSEW